MLHLERTKVVSMEKNVTSDISLTTIPLTGNKQSDDPSQVNNTVELCSPSEIAVALETTEHLLENCHELAPSDEEKENNQSHPGRRQNLWVPKWIRKHYRCYEEFVSTTHFNMYLVTFII